MLAVGLGAFGAHGLKAVLSAERLATFETGVRYQFYHALALMVLGIWLRQRKNKAMRIGGWLLFGGILLFSGSLYLLALGDVLSLPMGWVGPVTPLGGLLFIAGWGALLLATWQDSEQERN